MLLRIGFYIMGLGGLDEGRSTSKRIRRTQPGTDCSVEQMGLEMWGLGCRLGFNGALCRVGLRGRLAGLGPRDLGIADDQATVVRKTCTYPLPPEFSQARPLQRRIVPKQL